MARFCTLFSGSSGNSSYIGSGEGGLLVDVGMSCKQILLALGKIGVDPESLRGILITHEHIDHIRGLKVLLKKHKIPVYASPRTATYLIVNELVPDGAVVISVGLEEFYIDEFLVQSFDISHDATEPRGYKITTQDGRTISYATDLGAVDEQTREIISGSDLVLLEANYDENMLYCGRYPYDLKLRIKSSIGHLSNEQSAEEALFLCKSGTTRIILGHLSQENNMPAIAYQTVHNALSMAGLVENIDFILKLAPRSECGEMVYF